MLRLDSVVFNLAIDRPITRAKVLIGNDLLLDGPITGELELVVAVKKGRDVLSILWWTEGVVFGTTYILLDELLLLTPTLMAHIFNGATYVGYLTMKVHVIEKMPSPRKNITPPDI